MHKKWGLRAVGQLLGILFFYLVFFLSRVKYGDGFIILCFSAAFLVTGFYLFLLGLCVDLATDITASGVIFNWRNVVRLLSGSLIVVSILSTFGFVRPFLGESLGGAAHLFLQNKKCSILVAVAYVSAWSLFKLIKQSLLETT